ncbi:IPT/TIG domain-containing protein [Streptomyces sp. NBC_00513]|uniref:IPT/TIG domain-containing protein n=1 Tax=Streptomyces sp. NBC_00513 TaxID=2975763 RepID=UPI00224EA71A|nr:IPT/TIG domain-containing protein [Streptomyces sp. NBC_00424]WUD39038.1 IPT/TIG domain-containing protein [Streptomyces sp. NBC_00513]WUD45691.1 IPT/TIG domain-containing protein [Streptomyces sp. NBC_00513]
MGPHPYGWSPTTPAARYAYGPPTVTSISPATGPAGGGNKVTLTGTNLADTTAVTFGPGGNATARRAPRPPALSPLRQAPALPRFPCRQSTPPAPARPTAVPSTPTAADPRPVEGRQRRFSLLQGEKEPPLPRVAHPVLSSAINLACRRGTCRWETLPRGSASSAARRSWGSSRRGTSGSTSGAVRGPRRGPCRTR